MLAGLRFYDISLPATAFTAQIDLIEIVGHASRLTWITGLELGQTTEVGDAQEEQLTLEWILGHTTSGNGTATTPGASGNDAAYGGTVERFATTLATGGSPVTRRTIPWNVRIGYTMLWDPTKWLMVPAGSRMVGRVSGPADSVTGASSIFIAEAG
jgi:hypothetical protein